MLVEVMGPSGVGKTTILAAAERLRDLDPPQWIAPNEASRHFSIIPGEEQRKVLDDLSISDIVKRIIRMLSVSSMRPSQVLTGLRMLQKSEFDRQCIRGANFSAPVVHDELLMNRALSLFLYSSDFERDVGEYLRSIAHPDAVVIVTNTVEGILDNIEERGKSVNVYRGLVNEDLETVVKRGLDLSKIAAKFLKKRGLPVLELDSCRSVTDNAHTLHTWISETLIGIPQALTDLQERLIDETASFQTDSGRHTRRDPSNPYASFITRNVSVLHGSAQRDTAERLLRFGVRKRDIQGQRILDLGCNTGSLLLQLSNYRPMFSLGIEYDSAKTELATEIAIRSGLQDLLEFRSRDLVDVAAHELGTFDIVFCLAIEGHISDRDHLFDLLGQVTGSTLYFEGNGGGDVNEIARRLRHAGFQHIDYLGECRDDMNPSNNVRPLIVARK